jgi:D-amino-acid oxidase
MISSTSQFAVSDLESLPSFATHSVSFTSLTMTPLIYLNRLLDRIHGSSGHANVHRHHVPSLSTLSYPHIIALTGAIPLAVVVCTGIGAITLGDVEDKTVFPIRGQIVKVRAPWIRTGWTRQVGSLNGGEGGERTYVIPRADGEVVLGGTREVNDWNPYPTGATTRSIVRRALEICPDLASAHHMAPLSEGLIRDALTEEAADEQAMDSSVSKSPIIETIVGFRPSRTAGVRLERGSDLVLDQQRIKVVYNYGHGGAGWQSCWGTAADAVAVLLGAVSDDA